jgi:hypothetical protein
MHAELEIPQTQSFPHVLISNYATGSLYAQLDDWLAVTGLATNIQYTSG